MLKHRNYLGLVAAFVLLTAVATRAYSSIGAAEDTLGWVEHTGQVVQQIEALSSGYARAASARRAYILAGDASQLRDLPELDGRITGIVSDLRASVMDNPAQLARLERLDALIRERIAGLDVAVEQRRRTGTGVETGDTLALTSHIRTTREEMENEESRLLRDRDARTRVDVSHTKTAVVVGTLASFLMLLGAFRLLRQENARTRSLQKFLDSVIENLPTMVFVKGARDLRFERVNRAGEELIGVSRANLLGKTDYEVFTTEEADAFRERDRQTLAGRHERDVLEEPITTPRGERWLHTKTVPVLDDAGEPAFVLGISEDITDRRSAAAALRTAKDDAEAANRELETFSYSVAHDLRAPLRGINGLSAALLEDLGDKLDAESSDHLGRIVAGADRMGHLIDALLALSRLSRTELHTESVDLSRLAHTVVAQLRSGDPARIVAFHAADDLMTDGDPALLRALLENVLGNAWKFTRNRDSATIDFGRKTGDEPPVYFVRDDGAGFDMALYEKLFTPFRRLHKETDFEGTGIGLATVQRIVRRHGGKLWAEGAEGKGATIYFTLAGGAHEGGGA